MDYARARQLADDVSKRILITPPSDKVLVTVEELEALRITAGGGCGGGMLGTTKKVHTTLVSNKPLTAEQATGVEATLAERGSRYGDFSDHARVCQDLKKVMMNAYADNHLAWIKLTNVQKQALEVIADKVARILSGDPNYADNWHDIQGYAKLVEDCLPKETK